MKRTFLFILLIWCVFGHTGFGQMVVTDPAANTQRAVGQKLDVVRQKIQATSQILLNGMAGDITGALEVLSEQKELLENAEELKTTLDDIIITSKAYKLFKGNAELTKQQFNHLEKRYKSILDDGQFTKKSIDKVNTTLSSASRAYSRSIDTYTKAIDLVDKIDRSDRLLLIQDAEKQLEEAEKKFNEADQQISKLEALQIRRKGLIHDFTAPAAGFILASNPYETQKMQELSTNMVNEAKDKSGSRVSIRSARAKELFDIFFGYGELILGMIWVLLILSAFRGKNSVINIVSIGFYTTIGFLILKIVLTNLL